MGNFCTVTLIHNERRKSRGEFTEALCKAMETQGYAVGTEEDSELSYGLVFSENSDWVTLGSLEEDQMSQPDSSGWLSVALHTCCISVSVVDSDFAILEMHQGTLEAADTAILGDASGYMEEDVSRGNKECWEPLLSEGSTWEQLLQVFEGNYVFAEDGLDKMGALLGMDMRGVTMDWRDVDEEDTDITVLHFQKGGKMDNVISFQDAKKRKE